MFPLRQKSLIRGCAAHKNSGLGCAADYRASYVPLYMPFDGRVTRRFSEEGGGNWIEVTDRNGIKIQFAHLNSYKVGVGTYRQGTVIAITGNTGRITTMPHLHVQMIASNGVRIDPTGYNWDSGGSTPPPSNSYKFNRDLWFGVNSPEVRILQQRLKDQGHFPNSTATTNYYGPVTRGAVQSFQRKYEIVYSGAGYGRFGPKTRAKMNSL